MSYEEPATSSLRAHTPLDVVADHRGHDRVASRLDRTGLKYATFVSIVAWCWHESSAKNIWAIASLGRLAECK